MSRYLFLPLILLFSAVDPSYAEMRHADSAPLVRVEFQWEAVEDAVGYHVEVSDDPKFNHILKVVDGESTVQSLELPPRARYFIRVAARDIDGELGPFAGSEVLLPAPPITAQGKPPVPVIRAAPEDSLDLDLAAGEMERVVVPRSVLPWYWPTQVEVGAGGWLRNEAISSADFRLSSRGGVPAWSLGVVKQVGENELSVEGDFGALGYHSRALSSQVGVASSMASPENERVGWRAARFFWKSYWGRASFPMSVGLGYANQADFYRLSDDTLGYRQVSSFALLIGPSFSIFKEHKFFADMQMLAELAALGTSRGAGVLARARFGILHLWGAFSPELQLLFHPSYYRIGSPDRSFLRMDFGPTVFLTFAFEPIRPSEAEGLE